METKKESEKFKCAYPTEHGCKLEGKFVQSFELINEKGSNVELLFCRYHHCIVMGGHFKAKIIKTPAIAPTKKEPKGSPEKTDFEIIGPLNEVEIAEQVMGAREMIAQFKSDNK